MELLTQAEPVDFTPEETDPFKDNTHGYSSVNSTWDTSNMAGSRYQSQAPPRGTGSRFDRQPSNSKPPKNIFDDV